MKANKGSTKGQQRASSITNYFARATAMLLANLVPEYLSAPIGELDSIRAGDRYATVGKAGSIYGMSMTWALSNQTTTELGTRKAYAH